MLADSPLQPRRRHVAGWTGQEMLVWGGESSGSSLSDGAAYDPMANTWRSIALSTLEWRPNSAATWTGTEWVVSTSAVDGDSEVLEFAAYDPARDEWRHLPTVESRLDTETALVWTGEDLVVLNSTSGIHRLREAADAWEPLPPIRLAGGLAWTGTDLVAMSLEYLGTDEPRYRSTMAEWNPQTNEWRLIRHPFGDRMQVSLGRIRTSFSWLQASYMTQILASGGQPTSQIPPTDSET